MSRSNLHFKFRVYYFVLLILVIHPSVSVIEEEVSDDSLLSLVNDSPESFVADVDSAIAPKKKGTPVPILAATGRPMSLSIDCQRVPKNLLSMDPDFCCFGPTIFNQETLFNCQLNNRNRADWFYDDPPDNECVALCMFETHNLITNGTIDKERLLNQTLRNRSFDRPLWEPIVRTSIDECLKPERMQVNATGPVVCASQAYLVQHCLNAQIYKNCPIESRNNNTECDSLRSFVGFCDFIPKHQTYIYN